MAKRHPRPRAHLVTQIIAFLFLIFGAAVALYPFYVGALNDMIDNYQLTKVEQANRASGAKRMAAMAAENRRLKREGLNANADPFTGMAKQQKADLNKDMLGTVTVPKLKLTVPLFQTLSEQTLEVGAAVVPGTSMPVGGANTHTVIAGHRGLVDRRLFSDLNRVQKGDVFVLKVFKKPLAYKVFRIQVVKPEDTSILKIEPGRDLATLLTCTPYMVNSHRLLITGKRVPYTAKVAKSVAQAQSSERWQQLAIFAAALGALGLLVLAMGKRIHTLLLRRHVFNLLFYRVDETGRPLAGVRYRLCKKNGQPLYRRGQMLEMTTDADGQGFIDHLPGGVYTLKELTPVRPWAVRVGKKKLRQAKMRFYPTKAQARAVRDEEGRWVIWR
ncbi:class C sortase [Lacticaseibacillus absianus]|uniref:class C sortase n=1 Tax=Lacticaseibacillus absianus TaxID=2729623 RepID=UPI0015CC7F68|nr:class C sortase [Lacticaseibacillus absianus]